MKESISADEILTKL